MFHLSSSHLVCAYDKNTLCSHCTMPLYTVISFKGRYRWFVNLQIVLQVTNRESTPSFMWEMNCSTSRMNQAQLNSINIYISHWQRNAHFDNEWIKGPRPRGNILPSSAASEQISLIKYNFFNSDCRISFYCSFEMILLLTPPFYVFRSISCRFHTFHSLLFFL